MNRKPFPLPGRGAATGPWKGTCIAHPGGVAGFGGIRWDSAPSGATSQKESERAGSVPGLAAQNAEKCRWHRHPGRPGALDGLGRGERLEGSMSGTTIRTESNVVSMLDRMMEVESGSPQVGTRPPESGTIVFQDGRQRVFEQAKGGETLGPILDLIRARTSHEVAEGII